MAAGGLPPLVALLLHASEVVAQQAAGVMRNLLSNGSRSVTEPS